MVIEAIRDDKELQEFVTSESKKIDIAYPSEFSKHIIVLFTHRADDLLQYVKRIELPAFKEDRMRMMKWILDVAIMVYTACDQRNDFFMLHGITAAWSLKQIISLLDELHADISINVFLCSLLAVYIVQGRFVFMLKYGTFIYRII